jgi:hypothetical protein
VYLRKEQNFTLFDRALIIVLYYNEKNFAFESFFFIDIELQIKADLLHFFDFFISSIE